MASGEAAAAAAEPLQFKTTVLRVSIHCEGCRKKVKKVLSGIDGVYTCHVDARQHRVTVTGNVDADTLIRRLYKSGKQAVLWPVEAKKPEAAAATAPAANPPAAESGKDADAKEAKPKEQGKQQQAESSDKKPDAAAASAAAGGGENTEKKAEQADQAKPKTEVNKGGDSETSKPKDKSPESSEQAKVAPAAAAAAEELGNDEEAKKKGKKKKNKQKDAGNGEADAAPPAAAAGEPVAVRSISPMLAAEHAGYPYSLYGPPPPAAPVMSYNMAQPSASVSYYAPQPVMSMQPTMPMPMHPAPYMYSPYPAMAPAPEPEYYYYGPPGTRSPPQDSYHLFNDENPNSCSLM